MGTKFLGKKFLQRQISDGRRMVVGMSSEEPLKGQSAKSDYPDAPIVSIVVGMAGAGKTTFMQRLNSHLRRLLKTPYILNLDPAVLSVPYPANVDIRDTIDYKQVMKQYNLGPNGGILTSLNLFTTKFDQVLQLLEKRADEKKMSHVLIDTPGQIEIFTWSASGAIITDALASSFPTVLTYVIDSPRSKSCSTFMSSMLYAVSILYKTKLPMIIVFNKTDLEPCETRIEWMRDFEAFQVALRAEEEENNGSNSGYMSSLMNSMSLVLEEFYNHLDVVGVSSMTGDGFDDYLECLARKKAEYWNDYRPELEAMKAQRDKNKDAAKKDQFEKLMKDMNGKSSTSINPSGPSLHGKMRLTDEDDTDGPAETVSDAEAADDSEDGELLDPDAIEDFESVETHPSDPLARRRRADNLGVGDLADLMGGLGNAKRG